MTGRENYTRTIECTQPEYVPVLLHCPFDSLHEKDEAKAARIRELAARLPTDLLSVQPDHGYRVPPRTVDGVTRWMDHWGTEWEDDGHGAKTHGYPLQKGYHLVAEHPFPSAREAGIYEAAGKAMAARGDRYVLAPVWFTLFERLWMLRGFDNMLMDPYTDEERFVDLRDRVLAYVLDSIDAWVARGADGIYFSDDWGSQRGLLMNPDDWRRWYRPCYEEMFRRVREGGAHVWMHLCGDIREILPDLLDMGLNVLNPVQPKAMDVRELSRKYRGRVCFCGGADVQGVLIEGTPRQVRRHVHELVDLLGGYDGGYIISTSHGLMPETPLDNVVALYEAATAYV